jgi:hypothetical protein
MEERRYRPAVAAIGGKMYILGGEEGWDRYHGSIECYDPATGMLAVLNIMMDWNRYHGSIECYDPAAGTGISILGGEEG